MRRFLVLAVLACLVLGSVAPAAGQDPDSLARYIVLVAENLMNQETAIFEGNSTVTVSMDMGGASQVVEAVSDISGQYVFAEGEADFEAWYTIEEIELTMTMPGAGQMAFDLTVESLMTDATLYERTTSNNPMFASAFEEGWTILDDAAGTPGANPMADPTGMLPGIDVTKLPYVIGEDTVATVTELPPETIEDGREMRVFEIKLDMENVASQFGAWMSGMLPAEEEEGAGAAPDELLSGLLAEMETTWTMWIDPVTELPYRSTGTMKGPMTLDQQGMTLIMDLAVEFDMTFTEFSTPVTIEPPELGS
ncbi:MAG: hypothetical protein Kow0077_05530 [Anaerolineae bacterium]